MCSLPTLFLLALLRSFFSSFPLSLPPSLSPSLSLSLSLQALHPEWTNAGALAVVAANLSVPAAEYVGYDKVQWPGLPAPANTSKWGAADPRLTFRPHDGQYYLTWDNCTTNCYPTRQTMLSTTKDPYDPHGWTLQGPVLPNASYTAGASLLFRDGEAGPHVAFVSDSNTAHALMLAESDDGLHWHPPANASRRIFMNPRPGCWDQAGVAAGPQPERLSTGDYLYVYNIDTGFPYHPNPLGRCATGWAILDGADPSRIIGRSTGPLMTATLPWEQCPHKGYTCQETMVVFATGLKPLGNDEFLIIYGGADTDVGLTRIKVAKNAKDAAPAAAPAPLPLVPLNPYLFGYNLECYGTMMNVSFSDPAGRAMVQALHAGVLRYPGKRRQEGKKEGSKNERRIERRGKEKKRKEKKSYRTI